MLSVIVPLYNEGARVKDLLAHLREVGGVDEVVLADASDAPESVAVLNEIEKDIAKKDDGALMEIKLLRCKTRGRAVQMNAGAGCCAKDGAVFLFLHCDTRLPHNAAEQITQCIARGGEWGWFDLRLDARAPVYRVLERMINLRARLCRIATGDQAMFITQQLFARGFAEIPVMEDVEMSRRLKRRSTPTVIAATVVTSARRWQQNGIVCTVLLMWRLRFFYWLGGKPERLAAGYKNVR